MLFSHVVMAHALLAWNAPGLAKTATSGTQSTCGIKIIGNMLIN